MPFYEYECARCGCRFERRNTIKDRYTADCPSCGSSVCRLLVSLSDFRMEQPITVRRSDGSILDQKPRGGAVPPPSPPTPEQRDKEYYDRGLLR